MMTVGSPCAIWGANLWLDWSGRKANPVESVTLIPVDNDFHPAGFQATRHGSVRMKCDILKHIWNHRYHMVGMKYR